MKITLIPITYSDYPKHHIGRELLLLPVGVTTPKMSTKYYKTVKQQIEIIEAHNSWMEYEIQHHATSLTVKRLK